MESYFQQFIDSLVVLSETLQISYRKTMDYWQPDEPPITTLFAALGDQISEDFDNIGLDTSRHIFHLIEEAMNSNNSGLVTAVATGLIEAMVAQAARKDGLWERLSPLLGATSRHHAEAWLAK
jgi:hypothetical protein